MEDSIPLEMDAEWWEFLLRRGYIYVRGKQERWNYNVEAETNGDNWGFRFRHPEFICTKEGANFLFLEPTHTRSGRSAVG